MSEVRDFHPLVADWLTANGYTHQHHVKMPIGGIADFVATKNGQTFIVECKIGVPNYRAIVQTLDYCSQIDGSLPMIVCDETSDVFARLCEIKCVSLIVIPPNLKHGYKSIASSYFHDPLVELALAPKPIIPLTRDMIEDVLGEKIGVSTEAYFIIELHDKCPNLDPAYAIDVIYRNLFGGDAKQLRERAGIGTKGEVRDTLTTPDLHLLGYVESRCAEAFGERGYISEDDALRLISEISAFAAQTKMMSDKAARPRLTDGK